MKKIKKMTILKIITIKIRIVINFIIEKNNKLEDRFEIKQNKNFKKSNGNKKH